MPDNEAAFFRNAAEFKTATRHGDGGILAVPIPAKLLREEAGKVELLDALASGGFIEWHRKI
jgi:hypothetical protein